MSKGQWPRCPNTGIPLKTLARVSEDYLTDEGNFRIDLLPDCNLFDARSISAACGFRDHDYFRRVVLTNPNCPIHVQQMTLDAAVSKDKDLAFQALLNDPLCRISVDKAWEMFNALLEANSAMLPGW